ncbi:MAG TPA: manganese efflux pump MntP family protein [Methanospirillum sp.]|nr:manganese efflux pump MntP family protein [Methanospirillum sp.]
MDLFSILAIAISLGMDCFAVCVAAGMAVREGRFSTIAKIAVLFGLFQTGMTALGWVGGTIIIGWIEPIDHWIAAGLLALIGGKMIQEGFSDGEKSIDYRSIPVLLVLAIATSIDALAVGLSFAVLQVQILIPAIAIGLGAFLMSLVGFWLGDRFGSYIGSRAEIIGGLILILIGSRILLEHLSIL